ncbi:hypothetical protein CCM_04214 [Cordyceps militaris CM01]|uniref:Regulator of phospholipase D SRF1 n=1 Tax=Cordyceps militaris (strain CM01) TaxID=983644 RepID=G3JE17_CORMM|nr:uncharacterized protein CCM_04214 [Cordyceps militaris CM01]EGX92842.1 hypothetical protein CCM_04214 [Cordyceps militaris CM01]
MTPDSDTRPGVPKSSSGSAVPSNSTSNTAHQTPPRLRPPRSLPPWIDSYKEEHDDAASGKPPELSIPPRAVAPQPNSVPQEPLRRVSRDGFIDIEDPTLGPAQKVRARIPHFLRYGRASMRGRKWDHLRSAEPVIVAGHHPSPWRPQATWHDFIASSKWGRPQNERSQVVAPEYLNDLYPNFNRQTTLDLDMSRPRQTRRRRALGGWKRLWLMALNHSLSPLVFRLIVIITSIIALGIAARIYRLEVVGGRTGGAESTQSLFAVAVDTVAIPYSAYMIRDEYTGKPLGLRPAVDKMSLILLDLFFIIFKSASTALAFEALLYHNVSLEPIRKLADGLAALMLIGLLAWTMNLSVNVFRVIEKLGGREDDGHV